MPASATPDIAGGAPQNCPTRAREEEHGRVYTHQALLMDLALLTLTVRNTGRKEERANVGVGRQEEMVEAEVSVEDVRHHA